MRPWLLPRCSQWMLMCCALRSSRSRSSVWSLKLNTPLQAPPPKELSIPIGSPVAPPPPPPMSAQYGGAAQSGGSISSSDEAAATSQHRIAPQPPPTLPFAAPKAPADIPRPKMPPSMMDDDVVGRSTNPRTLPTIDAVLEEFLDDLPELSDEHDGRAADRSTNAAAVKDSSSVNDATSAAPSEDDELLYESMRASTMGNRSNKSATTAASSAEPHHLLKLLESLVPKGRGRTRIAEVIRLLPEEAARAVAKKEDLTALLQRHAPDVFTLDGEEILRKPTTTENTDPEAPAPLTRLPTETAESVRNSRCGANATAAAVPIPDPVIQKPAHAEVAASLSDEALLALIFSLVPHEGNISLRSLMEALPRDVQVQITQKKYGLAHFLVKNGGADLVVGNDLVSRGAAAAGSEHTVAAKSTVDGGGSSSSVKSTAGSAPTATTAAAAATPSSAAPVRHSAAPVTPTASSPRSKLAPPPLPKFPKKAPAPLSPSAMSSHQSYAEAFQMQKFRTPHEILALFIEFIPTYWVEVTQVQAMLSDDARQVFEGKQKFVSFLRKYRFFFDLQQASHGPEVKLRDEVQHPRRGAADTRFAKQGLALDILTNIPATAEVKTQPSARLQPPQQQSSTTTTSSSPPLKGISVLAHVWNVCPTEFIRLDDLEKRVPPCVFRDPTFDTIGGIREVLHKNFEIFQIVEGQVRRRPASVAPNAIDEKCSKTSPAPEIYTTLLAKVPPDGKTFVGTSELFALLTADERQDIKSRFRSFPRFLRMHGRDIHVSPDNLSVRRYIEAPPPTFHEEFEQAEKIAAAMASEMQQQHVESSGNEESAVAGSSTAAVGDAGGGDDSVPVGFPQSLRELYDALPLMQAAELEDVVFMLPPSVRSTLPPTTPELVEDLRKYPDHFSVWAFPDDESVMVVQRARLQTADVTEDDMARQLHSLIPQGGIDADRLLRKSPLALQRYFYKNGLKKTLLNCKRYFIVSGNKIMKVV